MVQVNGIEIIFKIGVTSTLVADYLTKDPRAGPGTLSDVHDYAVPPSEELLTTVDGPYLYRFVGAPCLPCLCIYIFACYSPC